MTINTKKIYKISLLFLAIVALIYFTDFALGAFMEGWNNPK
ncbi:hypothetical protein [Formosa agariphila]|nr:hypothetical protein [Formosa agariphila]